MVFSVVHASQILEWLARRVWLSSCRPTLKWRWLYSGPAVRKMSIVKVAPTFTNVICSWSLEEVKTSEEDKPHPWKPQAQFNSKHGRSTATILPTTDSPEKFKNFWSWLMKDKPLFSLKNKRYSNIAELDLQRLGSLSISPHSSSFHKE